MVLTRFLTECSIYLYMRYIALLIVLTSCSSSQKNTYYGYERKQLMTEGKSSQNKADFRLPLIWYAERF